MQKGAKKSQGVYEEPRKGGGGRKIWKIYPAKEVMWENTGQNKLVGSKL